MGGGFLALQGYEWSQLIRFGLELSFGVYGGAFFVLIGCHALHVCSALIWLVVIWFRTRHPEACDGSKLPLKRFRGQLVLLVNTASYCGYTPQYKGLQALWETYRDRGLMVVGIPSNDFGRQELGAQNAPRWNFHKYLIAPDGRVVATWPSNVRPLSDDVKRSIETWLDPR